MEEEKKQDLKKKVQKTAIAATTAASLFVHNTYDTPLEIVNESYEDDDVNDSFNQKKKSSFKVKIKQILNTLPLPIKIVFLLPLWSLGWILMLIIRPILNNLLPSIFSELSHWLILAIIIVVVILISAKMLFPSLPLSKLVNKKSISLILFLLIILAISDKLLSMYFPTYNNFKNIVNIIGYFSILIRTLIYIYLKTKKLKFTVTNDKYTFSN